MNIAPIKTGLAACSLFLFFSAGEMNAAGSPAIDLRDQELFSPEFFPDLAEVSEDQLLLAGLSSLYPERILDEAPSPVLPEPAPPVIRDLGPNGTYIRVLHLPSALAVIEEHLASPLVVLDLRFLTTDLESAFALGALLTRREQLQLARAGDFPVPRESIHGDSIRVAARGLRPQRQTVFTLSNRETRGPVEAVLAQLRNDGDVISVGAPSPGQTSVFRPFPGFESYYLISGELRPADGASLAESGFVPHVHVNVAPADDRIAYGSLREDVSLDDLVEPRIPVRRRGESAVHETPDEEPAEEIALPTDIILQRALNIVKALEALGRIGE